MPRLTDERKRFCEDNYPFVRWVYREYLSKGLIIMAIDRLGSVDDVWQVLACEFCRIIASVTDLRGVPNFMANQLAEKLREVVNLVRNNIIDGVCSLEKLLRETSLEQTLLVYEEVPELDGDEVFEKLKGLIDLAAEPTRTMCYRFLINGELCQDIGKDYGITGRAVRSRVSLWIIEMKEAVLINKEKWGI